MVDKLAINGGSPSVSISSNRLWPFYDKEVEEVIANKIRKSQVFATNIDPDIEQLEQSFVNKLCPDHFSLFCSSGTSALMTAYFSLGLDKGAEVLVQSNTFRATATPLFLLNLVPTLCDSNNNGSLSIEDAEKELVDDIIINFLHKLERAKNMLFETIPEEKQSEFAFIEQLLGNYDDLITDSMEETIYDMLKSIKKGISKMKDEI